MTLHKGDHVLYSLLVEDPAWAELTNTDAKAFAPDRFLSKKIPTWIPFGTGRSTCPALNYAPWETILILFNILSKFEKIEIKDLNDIKYTIDRGNYGPTKPVEIIFTPKKPENELEKTPQIIPEM
jgi:cytochrome P450